MLIRFAVENCLSIRERQELSLVASSLKDRHADWVVFDRDEHPNFIEAIAKAESLGILVAYSNPCFELWLVLHYQDYDRPVRRDEIQKALRTLMPGYDPNRSKQVLFHDICDAIERAERRAEILERRRDEERDPKGNPSTSVFKLTREIRKYSDN